MRKSSEYLVCLILVLTIITKASAVSSYESEFVGMYTQRDVDSQAQLFLLDDHTFCFTFMGGSLDLLKAGRWKATPIEGTINLQEIRPDTPIYPALGKNLDRLGPAMIGINFDGYSLSNATSPVFAVASTDTLPSTFRPIFPNESSSWSQTYALPLMPAENVKYFYIGDIELDKYGKPIKLRVLQYKIGSHDAIRIGFNNIQSDPPMNVNAKLINNVLQLDRDTFGSKRPLTATMIEEVKERCVNPAIYPDKVSLAKNKSQEQLPAGSEILTPTKSFNLDIKAIAGKPFFETKDGSDTVATDSLDDLLESEQTQLQLALKNATGEMHKVDEFLSLTKELAGKKRFKRHAPQIVKSYAELLVTITANGNLAESKKILQQFMVNIYPLTLGVKNDGMSYSISVIASQGLIMAVSLKETDISKIVFEKLLGDQFDIATHKNSTLIYNLACYYATNNKKAEMLNVVKEARKRGKLPKQFMSDADFKSYWSDADFINAIN